MMIEKIYIDWVQLSNRNYNNMLYMTQKMKTCKLYLQQTNRKWISARDNSELSKKKRRAIWKITRHSYNNNYFIGWVDGTISNKKTRWEK